MSLNEQILTAVMESGLTDHDQRSALGIARTWIDKQKPIARSTVPGYSKRDDLAEKLVGILEESGPEYDHDDFVRALAKARAKVNEPFRDPSMLGAKRNPIERPNGEMMGKPRRQVEPAKEQK